LLSNCPSGRARRLCFRSDRTGADEAGEQRVRFERPGFQLGVVLHADEPGMDILGFDGFRQQPIGRDAGEDQASFFERSL
jgi:hypothetical protein